MDTDRSNEHAENKKSIGDYFKNIRILVIEKNITNLNLLKEYLHSFGLNAEYASSEEGALEMIWNAAQENQKPYGLLLLDSQTPQSGGIEFYKQIKTQLSFKTVPKCILMIPLNNEGIFDQLEAAGIDFGITKPILPSILFNGIVEVFKINLLGMHNNSAKGKKEQSGVTQYHYSILVVEDNKTNQFIAQSILEQSGFTVFLADNGQEGVDFFLENKEKLDLILMDLHMPVMNGLDATEMIRKAGSDIPIIAMTADAIAGVEERCKSVGIDYYISKPFEPEQFVETIVKVIHSSGKKERLKDTKPASAPEATAEEVSEAAEKIETRRPDQGQDMINEEDGIRRIGGNPLLYRIVLRQYHEENKGVADVLAEKLTELDYEEAEKIVHKIKSSSGSIGARRLQEAASSLQKALSDRDSGRISQLGKDFTLYLEQVLAEIERKLPDSSLTRNNERTA